MHFFRLATARRARGPVTSMAADQFLCVSTTLDSRNAAQVIATKCVELGLAACVQVIGPVESVYRWHDSIEKSEEWLCLAKTDRAHFAELKDTLLNIHPYDEPEIIATEIVGGSAGYLSWLGDQLC